jgi:hypothetical protein
LLLEKLSAPLYELAASTHQDIFVSRVGYVFDQRAKPTMSPFISLNMFAHFHFIFLWFFRL